MAVDVRSRLAISDEALVAFCRKWKIVRLELFGSALREDFTAESDVDLLYTLEEGANWSWEASDSATDELSTLLGRKVDLVSRPVVETGHNWMRRREILGTARELYSAG